LLPDIDLFVGIRLAQNHQFVLQSLHLRTERFRARLAGGFQFLRPYPHGADHDFVPGGVREIVHHPLEFGDAGRWREGGTLLGEGQGSGQREDQPERHTGDGAGGSGHPVTGPYLRMLRPV
jgi:hypothetical protein